MSKAQHKYLPTEYFRARAQRRDAKFALKSRKAKYRSPPILPVSFSLRDKVPEIYDQGDLGSCTANAFAASYRVLSSNEFKPSRLWFYFYERLSEDPTHQISNLTDSGANVIDGLDYVHQYGVCSEDL
jgi:hypothetical protein